jgi:hypothetical protein
MGLSYFREIHPCVIERLILISCLPYLPSLFTLNGGLSRVDNPNPKALDHLTPPLFVLLSSSIIISAT